MHKKYNIGLFIFRRDLRMHDNSALIAATARCDAVIPIFIFDPRQIGNDNPYRSLNAIQFMIESLEDLQAEIKKGAGTLYFFHGIAHEMVKKLLVQEKVDAIFCNEDYTPFSKDRDHAIQKECAAQAADFLSYSDLLLHAPTAIVKNNKEPYSIFTPYYKKALTIPVARPAKKICDNFTSKAIKSTVTLEYIKKLVGYSNPRIAFHGGYSQALITLKNIKNLKEYATTHNILSVDTSHLSAHLKFGTISIRQVYWHIVDTLGHSHPLLRQLYWRDFFTQTAYHFAYVFGSAYHEKYNALPWKNDPKEFKAWCTGTTGFPIVDAGMRQLNTTGFMHNRARLIVGSFVVKDLHIDWQWAEKYFATQLIDYDPSINNGNWQWVASTGCDAQPYFRIFNPWIQQKKFDPQCEYIKKWVSELKDVDIKTIHNWAHSTIPPLKNYPKPIVDHAQESAKTKLIYKRL